jgi:hypothetical protein
LIQITPSDIDFQSFLNFWKKYYPHKSRLKVVFQGEHELSKRIGTHHLRPATEKIEYLVPDFKPEERHQLINWIARSNPTFLSNFEFNNLDIKESDELMVRFAFENCQVSNALGLYLTRKYHFPLKLDLPYFLLVSKYSIVEILRNGGCSDIEIKKVGEIFESKGSINIGSPWQRLSKSFGIQA